MKLIESTGADLRGKHAVVIGRSNTVGKPMALLLLQANATVTICHSATPDLGLYTRQADVVVAAVGRRNTLTAGMVKPGAIVIDVGMNRDDAGKPVRRRRLCRCPQRWPRTSPRCRAGVGPMTITMLLMNTVESAERVHSAQPDTAPARQREWNRSPAWPNTRRNTMTIAASNPPSRFLRPDPFRRGQARPRHAGHRTADQGSGGSRDPVGSTKSSRSPGTASWCRWKKPPNAWAAPGAWFNHLNNVMDTPELRAVYNENQPKVTEFWTSLGQNEALFAKYKLLRAGSDYDSLNPARKKIVENALRDFRLGGAELPEVAQAALRRDPGTAGGDLHPLLGKTCWMQPTTTSWWSRTKRNWPACRTTSRRRPAPPPKRTARPAGSSPCTSRPTIRCCSSATTAPCAKRSTGPAPPRPRTPA